MTLLLTDVVHADIRSHAEMTYPEEGAGFLLGRVQGDRRIVKVVLPQPNQFDADHRRRRYRIEPDDMLRAEQVAEEQSYEILGIFHSHPDHPAEPSSFDLEWSLPWFSYLITSVHKGKATESRSWRLKDDRGGFNEEHVELVQSNQPD